MPRTTITIDPTVLKELKALSKREGKSLGQVVSEHLAATLGSGQGTPPAGFKWFSKSMHPRVDLEDKDAVYGVLDEG